MASPSTISPSWRDKMRRLLQEDLESLYSKADSPRTLVPDVATSDGNHDYETEATLVRMNVAERDRLVDDSSPIPRLWTKGETPRVKSADRSRLARPVEMGSDYPMPSTNGTGQNVGVGLKPTWDQEKGRWSLSPYRERRVGDPKSLQFTPTKQANSSMNREPVLQAHEGSWDLKPSTTPPDRSSWASWRNTAANSYGDVLATERLPSSSFKAETNAFSSGFNRPSSSSNVSHQAPYSSSKGGTVINFDHPSITNPSNSSAYFQVPLSVVSPKQVDARSQLDTSLQEELKKTCEDLEVSRATIEVQKELIAKMEQRDFEHRSAIEFLNQENSRLQVQIKRSSESEGAVVALKKQLEDAQQVKEVQERKIRDLRFTIESLENELSVAQERLQALEVEKDEICEVMQQQTIILKQLSAEDLAKDGEHSRLRMELQELRSQAEARSSHESSLKAQVARLEAENKEMKTLLSATSASQAELKELRDKLAELREVQGDDLKVQRELQSALKEANSKIESLDKELKASILEKRELKDKLAEQVAMTEEVKSASQKSFQQLVNGVGGSSDPLRLEVVHNEHMMEQIDAAESPDKLSKSNTNSACAPYSCRSLFIHRDAHMSLAGSFDGTPKLAREKLFRNTSTLNSPANGKSGSSLVAAQLTFVDNSPRSKDGPVTTQPEGSSPGSSAEEDLIVEVMTDFATVDGSGVVFSAGEQCILVKEGTKGWTLLLTGDGAQGWAPSSIVKVLGKESEVPTPRGFTSPPSLGGRNGLTVFA